MKLLDKISLSPRSPDRSNLRDPGLSRFQRVRSIDECIDIFESEAWIERDGLSESIVSMLAARCGDMRRHGLGLEPNLIGRAATRLMTSPQRIGEASLLFGAQDGDFAALVADADKRRDGGDYTEAEYAYYRALTLFPGHPAVRVQYAHMLKEQHKYADALVNYLDAALYGAPLTDVREHALFVASRLDVRPEVTAWLSDLKIHRLSSALRAIYRLLFGQEASVEAVLGLMLKPAGLAQVFADLISESGFRNANRDLIRVVAETGWRPQGA